MSCFTPPGARLLVHGKTYLFTGDTLFLSNGTLQNGYIEGESSKSDLTRSIQLLRELVPNVVISAAALGGTTLRELSLTEWRLEIDRTLRSLSREPQRRAS